MSKPLSWKSGYDYCSAKNRDGTACGNKVPKGFRVCATHRRAAERARRKAEAESK